MQKLIFIMIPIIFLVFVIIFTETNYFKLHQLGYNNDEIKIIKNKLNNDIDYFSKLEHDSTLINIIKNKNFNAKRLKRYIEYYTNNSNIKSDTIISIVNNDIDLYTSKYDDVISDLINSDYFILKNIERYINYYNQSNTNSPQRIISVVNSNADYDFYTNIKNADMNKNNLVLVNKFYKLDTDFVPDNLVTIDSNYGKPYKLTEEVYNQYKQMCDDALLENIHLFDTSAYRSYDMQASLYKSYSYENGQKTADTYSARPGHSEHQTGLAIDIITRKSDFDKFDETKEFNWLKQNADKYGFILRYPKGKEYITGYVYEPWHYRYVGEDVAQKIKELKITFDEYYAYFIK